MGDSDPSFRVYTPRDLWSIPPSSLRVSHAPPKKGFGFAGFAFVMFVAAAIGGSAWAGLRYVKPDDPRAHMAGRVDVVAPPLPAETNAAPPSSAASATSAPAPATPSAATTVAASNTPASPPAASATATTTTTSNAPNVQQTARRRSFHRPRPVASASASASGGPPVVGAPLSNPYDDAIDGVDRGALKKD